METDMFHRFTYSTFSVREPPTTIIISRYHQQMLLQLSVLNCSPDMQRRTSHQKIVKIKVIKRFVSVRYRKKIGMYK